MGSVLRHFATVFRFTENIRFLFPEIPTTTRHLESERRMHSEPIRIWYTTLGFVNNAYAYIRAGTRIFRKTLEFLFIIISISFLIFVVQHTRTYVYVVQHTRTYVWVNASVGSSDRPSGSPGRPVDDKSTSRPSQPAAVHLEESSSFKPQSYIILHIYTQMLVYIHIRICVCS